MEAIPSGFKSPLSHRNSTTLTRIGKAAATAMVVAACVPSLAYTPTPVEAAQRLRTALENSAKEPGDDVLGALTPGSRVLVEQAVAAGRFGELRTRLLDALKDAKPVDGADGVVRGRDPATTLFFVRDGHSRLLDLALSGVAFAALREVAYPTPW